MFASNAWGMSLCLFTEADLRAGRVTYEVMPRCCFLPCRCCATDAAAAAAMLCLLCCGTDAVMLSVRDTRV